MRKRTATEILSWSGFGAGSAARRLSREDFNRPTLQVAAGLLGRFIVCKQGARTTAAMITETEAYVGPRDRASHARGGRRTPRVEPLYMEGGTIYVYFVYGMHWLLNFSTAGAGNPEGVLIRAVVVADDAGWSPVVGPARVTRHFGIDKRFDGDDATRSRALWVEDRGVQVPKRCIIRGPRVGVDFAGEYWAARPWRFRLELPAAATARLRA